jgi:GNAT superfamily N-acetyltransferase
MSQSGLDKFDLSHHQDLAAIEDIVMTIYAEVYATQLHIPFDSLERFRERLHKYAAAPGFDCVIGRLDGEPVGLVYGYALQEGANWWKGLQTPIESSEITEDGRRTFALCDIMVRENWRKTGISYAIHEELLKVRNESRVTLLVDTAHPKVRTLYERWGYHQIGTLLPFPDAPLYDAMIRHLTE